VAIKDKSKAQKLGYLLAIFKHGNSLQASYC